jgi:arylsulfatase A-like enzyme
MPSSQPHILLITADELSAGVLPAYGGHAIATPGVDALARGGLTFDAAYTASHLCLPSRGALLTGLYPHRSGAYSNFRPCALRPELPNLYNLLRRGGYTTGHIGKCHYSPAPYHLTRPEATLDHEPIREFLLSLGLDHLDLLNGKMNSIWFWNDYSRELQGAGFLAPYREACWDQARGKVFAFPGPAHWHPDAWVGRKAVERLEALDPARPSFHWVSFAGPHYPMDPPAEYLQRVDPARIPPIAFQPGEWDDRSKIQAQAYHGDGPAGAEGRWFGIPKACKDYDRAYIDRLRHYYHANVVLIDDWVGRIVEVARRRFGENLLILFSADHGDMLGDHWLWAKNRCAYESVLRVPLIVQGGAFVGGGRTDARVSLLDVLPTCLQAAALDAPQALDGRPLGEQIARGGRPWIITEAEGFASIQDYRYKLIQARSQDGWQVELHDLRDDPQEFRNLAAESSLAPIVAELRARLVEHFLRGALA